MPVKKFINSFHQPETEFLPAALEIVERPASPLGRIVGGTIILFFLIALVWASFGTIDIIAVAPGKIMPSTRTKIIQPFETGVVRKILVEDGQSVKTGDILIEIDSTINESEHDRLQQEYMQAAFDAARFQAAAQLDTPAAFVAPENASPDQIALQQKLLDQQTSEIRSRLSSLDSQIAESEGKRNAVQSSISQLKESIPLLKQRHTIRKNLAERGYGAKLDALNTEQDLIEHEHQLTAQQAHLAEANGALRALKQQRQQAEAEYLRDTFNKLSEAQQKASSLNEQLTQATQRYHLQTIKAPVDGTVQQLAIHTEGGVVTPAQNLMAIVPQDSHLEIEAMVSNRDIGFVYPGQNAEIKIDTFNFTKYGLLHGKVMSVSQDAIPRAKPVDPSGKNQTGAENETSEPHGQELVYAARISLDQTQMDVDGKKVNLSPGMAATAEIKTGQRRVIEYLLSPLAKRSQQAFKER